MITKRIAPVSCLLLFLFLGSVVFAEGGSDTAIRAIAENPEKLEKERMQKEELMKKFDAKIDGLKVVKIEIKVVPAKIVDREAFRMKVEEKLVERRGEKIREFSEIRVKLAENLEDRWAYRELPEGKEKYLEQLRLAMVGATNINLETRTEVLNALRKKLVAKEMLSDADKEEIKVKVKEYQKEHLSTTAERILTQANAISTKLGNILTRLKNKMDELNETVPGAKNRLANLHSKLTRIKDHLDERIDDAETKLAAFKDSDEKENANALRASLHRLREWTKISVHAVTRFVAIVNHYQNRGEDADDDVLDSYEAEVLDLSEAEVVVEAAVEDNWLAETPVPTDDVSVTATQESRTESTDDSLEVETETEIEVETETESGSESEGTTTGGNA